MDIPLCVPVGRRLKLENRKWLVGLANQVEAGRSQPTSPVIVGFAWLFCLAGLAQVHRTGSCLGPLFGHRMLPSFGI